MSEPEDVILEGAHAASAYAARLWRRHVPGPPRVELDEVRRRLELLCNALFGQSFPVIVAEPLARPSFAGRLARRLPRHLLDERAHASTDGVRIRLPRAIEVSVSRAAVEATYRLLALQQGARAARGTPGALPEGTAALVRDLYMISEGAAIDRLLSLELPGLAARLEEARREALACRPRLPALTAREQDVERILRAVLEAPPAILPATLPPAKTSHASFLWARHHAAALDAIPGRYRGVPPVRLWGRLESLAGDPAPVAALAGAPRESRPVPSDRVRSLRRRPRVRPPSEDEDDGSLGMSMIQLDEPQEHVEDPRGLQRPADRDGDKNPDDLADSLAELPEARLVTVPGPPAEALVSDDPPARRATQPSGVPRRAGIAYPEWDYRIAAYRMQQAVVRELPPPLGDRRWVEGVLRRHGREVDAVRRRFERLRPQRVRLSRQVEGSDIDIAAYATAYADARAECGGEDRLYESVRPVRRDIAISLLVDVSASTDSWLSAERRIIDVEKEAVLLVCEGLDALGDRYSVTAFSGEGPESVALYPIKRFDERYGPDVRRRIAGLEHDRFTRMGAALRHATAALAGEQAHHRLLLLLTDGKPNDVDLYEGRYGIEDTRQAVAEARLQGLHPFCLTVDREAPAYLPRLFGPGAYAVLRRAHTLPQALIEVVRRLLHG